MLIKTYGTTRWTDKKMGKEMDKYRPMYINFNETCLKRHTKKYYRPDNLSDGENDFLAGLGIKLYVYTDLINCQKI